MNTIIRLVLCLIVAFLLLAVLSGAGGATTMPVPVFSAGVPGNDYSYNPAISADGRYITFDSIATNLVSGDTNGFSDIFVRDRTAGATTRVSKNNAGVAGDGASYEPSVSADGRYVAFSSYAGNLVSGDTNDKVDIFVRDRTAGATTRVSKSTAGVAGDGNSYESSVSADGRYVAFESVATNLVSGDTNGFSDIFVRDRQTGTTTRISRDSAGVEGNDNSNYPTISENGRYVAFQSDATNLVSGDTNGKPDIFVRDRQTGTTWRVSKSTAGTEGDGGSMYPAISADGRYLTFESVATNLVSGDTNTASDIFVRDRTTGTTARVSKNSAGVEGAGGSYGPAISADGRYVAFYAYASNLVSSDTNGFGDVFVRDRAAGATYRVSKSSAGAEGDSYSYYPTISGNGRYVTFESMATNLVSGDTNGVNDIFVRDRQTGTTYLVSKS